MQKSKTKMQNERLRFKEEFRQRVYQFALDVIEFTEQLPKEQGDKWQTSKRGD